MDGRYFIVNMYPHQMFPEELWGLIIEEMDDSEDISNVLHVFPQLSALLRGKQFSLQIGKVMPLLMKHLDVIDIRNSRLVSKRWKNAIGSALESHPDRLPYNSERHKLIDEKHFNYWKLPLDVEVNLKYVHDSGVETQLDASQENPFPGRYVKIFANVSDGDYMDKGMTMTEALPLLQKFGHHISYLFVLISTEGRGRRDIFVNEAMEPLFQCLSFLPNLKSFELVGHCVENETSNESNKSASSSAMERTDWPFKLETLDVCSFCVVPRDIFQAVVTSAINYSGIQKLGIHVNDWVESFGTLFPNLTELDLNMNGTTLGASAVAKVLTDLHSPKLRKLTIDIDTMNICELLDSIVPWNIESLEPMCCDMIEQMTKPETKVTSILSLKVFVGLEQRFRFLELLPALQFLTIEFFWEREEEYLPLDLGQDVHGPFQQSLRKLAFFGVTEWDNFRCFWDALPNLKMLTVRDEEQERSYQYVRECPREVVLTAKIL